MRISCSTNWVLLMEAMIVHQMERKVQKETWNTSWRICLSLLTNCLISVQWSIIRKRPDILVTVKRGLKGCSTITLKNKQSEYKLINFLKQINSAYSQMHATTCYLFLSASYEAIKLSLEKHYHISTCKASIIIG